MNSSFENPPSFPENPTGNAAVPAAGLPVPPGANVGSVLPTADERTMAMLGELLQLFSWFIGPLVIFLVKRDSAFVRFHALQAILWQIFMAMFYIVFFVVMIAMAVAMPKSGVAAGAAPVLFMVSLYGLLGFLSLANFIIAIYFAVKANSGAWASYPVIGSIARSILGL